MSHWRLGRSAAGHQVISRLIIRSAIVVSGISLLLSGCGGDEVATGEDATGEDTTEEVATEGDATEEVATEEWDEVVAAANEEGLVVWYSTDSEAVNASVIRAFNEQYPDIEVEVTRSGVDIAARVATEQESGISTVDVLASGFQELHETEDYFIELDGSVLPTLGEQTWPDTMRADTWVASKQQFLVMVWNTDAVDGDALNTWSDLLDPEFANNVILSDPRGSQTWFSWLDGVNQALGDEYVRQLADVLQFEVGASGVPAAQAVAAGTHALGFPQSAMLIADLQSQGAPVAFKVLTDPVVQSIGFLGVFQNAPHPNAARVFANFRASPAGMAAMCEAIGPPGETGFRAPFEEPVTECQDTPAGEIVQGDKTLGPDDDRYKHLMDLLGLELQAD